MIPEESITTQHRLVVLDICISRRRKRCIRQRNPRIKWWGLKGKKQYVFKDKLIKEDKWNLDEDVGRMWKRLIISKEWLRMYLENLKVGDRLRRLGGGISRFEQQLD